MQSRDVHQRIHSEKTVGAVGSDDDITVKILNGEQSMKLTAVSGLRISSSIAGNKEIWLNLPPVYTRENISVDIEEVATREDINVGIILQ